MGQIVDFAKTKALLMEITLGSETDHQVNLGVGDDENEFLLLFQGERMLASQLGDDELWELSNLYVKARNWVDLDLIGGPLPYETLEIVNENGCGIVLLCSDIELTGIQMIIHSGVTVLHVESDLIKDFHEVISWFVLNAVLLEA